MGPERKHPSLKPEPSKLAAWRPTGVTAGDDGALLDFEP